MATHESDIDRRLRLGPEDGGRSLSAEEFADAACDEPWTYERVGGRLEVMSPDGAGHVRLAEVLGR